MPQTAGRDAPKGSWVLGLGLARPRTQVRGPVYLYGSIKLILRASPGVTTLLPRACRLTLVVLLVRMWRLNAAPRTILPVPVFLNRFAAPLWVFNFSFFTFLAIPTLSLPLLPLRLASPLPLLVLILAVVHDSTDGRHGGRRNFDQVEAFLSGKDESLGRRHDAQLLPRVVDDANFTDPDALVDAQPVVATGRARSIESDTFPPATKISSGALWLTYWVPPRRSSKSV